MDETETYTITLTFPGNPDSVLTAGRLRRYHPEPEILAATIKAGGTITLENMDFYKSRNLSAAVEQNSTRPLGWE
jgi:hypothetical protein